MGGAPGQVWESLTFPLPRQMYDLTVAEAHTFFVGDQQWLVHNCNPWGRRGSPAHQTVVTQAEQRLTASEQWTTYSGGATPNPERAVAIPGGGIRYPDLVLQNGASDQIAIQVGRATQSGLPIARERRALQDLRDTGLYRHVFFLEYK